MKKHDYQQLAGDLHAVLDEIKANRLTKSRAGDGSSNIKDAITTRFFSQIPVLHRSMCISKAYLSISGLRDDWAKHKDKVHEVSDSSNMLEQCSILKLS